MHLAYREAVERGELPMTRRRLLQTGAAILVAGQLPSQAFAAQTGFRGSGRMGLSTGEDWIDTFFNGGAEAIVHYYADDFVFEDVTLFQMITDKESLYRAFLPFNNAGPDSPAGVHQFDVIRYDGGLAGDRRGVAREGMANGYPPDVWASMAGATLAGAYHDYDEWAVMNWVWKAQHNMDEFLGATGAKGKTTYTRGMTFHCYRERKIVREFTFWNFRDVAIQLGAMPPQVKFWEAPVAK